MKKVVVHSNAEDFGRIMQYCSGIEAAHFVDEESRTATIYVPDADLGATINDIRKSMNSYDKTNLIEVTTPDFVISRPLEKEEEKEAGKEVEPVEKLMQDTHKYAVLEWSKVTLTTVAALIALSGLFLDNIEIVVGAMLLSPLLGPVYGFAISLGVGKVKSAVRSIVVLVVLLLSSVAMVAVLTFVTSRFIPLVLTAQITSREVLSPLYVPIALLLGFASMLAMTKGIPEIAAGVAISVALVPPAAVAGILLVVKPAMAAYPAIIVAQNVLGLMAGALVSVMVLDLGPRRYYEKVVARRLMVRTSIIVAILIGITMIPFF